MKEVKCVTTNEARGWFWKEEQQKASAVKECMHVINVYPESEYQVVEGFGGAFTEASAHNFSRLSGLRQKQILENYFGTEGLNYNMGRITMNSCDFALGNYTYIAEGDTELKSFDIAHDQREILPMIHRAAELRKGDLEFLVSPWSPPAFMKDNHDMNHGGRLKKEYYGAWAGYFVRFIEEYSRQGVKIRSLTVQNEPEAVQTWDSCCYTPEEEAEFVAGYLGPALKEAGLKDIDIYIWDHNKDALFDRFCASMKNAAAAAYIRGAAVHWYTGDHFEAIELVKKRYPDSKVMFTEGCVEYSRFRETGEVEKAEMYAHDIMGNLNAGICGYLDWNLLLDETGGPNHVGNYCAAPMMCDPKTDVCNIRLSYYYIGHFSRYIQKGAVRIGTTKYSADLEVSGYRNPDNTRAVIVLNRSDHTKEITLREHGEGIMTRVEAHSIVTFLYEQNE